MNTQVDRVRQPAFKRQGTEAKEYRGILGKVRKRISKYVVFDKDGILKDPNWPHLWDKQ